MFEYHSLVYHVIQWGGNELLRSVHIPVDHEMVVAAMDRLARRTRETRDALAHEANIKREAADVEEYTQDVTDAPCLFAEGARGDTFG